MSYTEGEGGTAWGCAYKIKRKIVVSRKLQVMIFHDILSGGKKGTFHDDEIKSQFSHKRS